MAKAKSAKVKAVAVDPILLDEEKKRSAAARMTPCEGGRVLTVTQWLDELRYSESGAGPSIASHSSVVA